MRKFLLAIAAIALTGGVLVMPASAQAAYVLVTLGFVFNTYPTVDACLAAGAGIRSSVSGYIPNYYCIPVTNATTSAPVTGGGAGPF